MDNQTTGGMPDLYDRTLGNLHGLPGVQQTAPVTRRLIEPLIGNAQTWIVHTVRQKDEKASEDDADKPARFTVFLEYVGREGSIRMVLPPQVADLIMRQRDALTGKVRRRSAQQAAATRKARGIEPAFLKRKRR